MQRWISPDPLTIHGLGADPNCYAYVSGAALAAIDPLGLDELAEKTDAAVDSGRTGTVTPYEEIEAPPQAAQMCFKDEKKQEEAEAKQAEEEAAYDMRREDYYARVGEVVPKMDVPPPPSLNEKMATVTQSAAGNLAWGLTGSEEAAAAAAVHDPVALIAKKGGANPSVVRVPVATQPARVTPRPAPRLRVPNAGKKPRASGACSGAGGEACAGPPTGGAFTDPSEEAIAAYLRRLGRTVTKNPLEGKPGAGRQGDAFVDGQKHEFKTLDSGATSATVRNVVTNSIRNGGQAREIVIDARGTGLNLAEAQKGAARALGVTRGKLDGLTLIGDNYFFRWTPRK